MERVSKEANSEVDLTKPINSKKIMAVVADDDCFGRMWDLRTSECSKCADRDVCGIVYNDTTIKKKVDAVEKEQGSLFLDKTDYENVDTDKIMRFVKSGETTTKELIAYVMALALTSDRKSAIEFLKRFIPTTEGISTKAGIVWLK